MKLQELQAQRRGEFTTSSQIRDGVNYKLPIGGREGAHVSPDGKERNQSPIFKRPLATQQSPQHYQMDKAYDQHEQEMEGHPEHEPLHEIPENEQSPRYEQPHDEHPMYEDAYQPDELPEHDQMDPEHYEPEMDYNHDQALTPEHHNAKPADFDAGNDERDPKLYVDVNIGKSGVERIVVFEGDTA